MGGFYDHCHDVRCDQCHRWRTVNVRTDREWPVCCGERMLRPTFIPVKKNPLLEEGAPTFRTVELKVGPLTTILEPEEPLLFSSELEDIIRKAFDEAWSWFLDQYFQGGVINAGHPESESVQFVSEGRSVFRTVQHPRPKSVRTALRRRKLLRASIPVGAGSPL